MKKLLCLTISVILLLNIPVFAASTYIAKPTDSVVTLNGQKVKFAAYNIEGNNYFKLRDLATVLDGTEKNFNVDYNKKLEAIEITSLAPYTTGNAGISEADSKGNKVAIDSPQSVYVDGKQVTLKAYDVSSYNYCKLRDVANLLDFAVDWNPNTNTINIGTDRSVKDSINVEKFDIYDTPFTGYGESLPIANYSTERAIRDIKIALAPGTVQYSLVIRSPHVEHHDWEQLFNDPYSSPRLSLYFDEYKKYGVVDSFELSVMGWLRNGGDDGVAHGEVFG